MQLAMYGRQKKELISIMRDRETYVCLREAFNLLVAYVSLDELNIASVHPRADRLRLN
jgi:hypothetical protein